MKERIISKLKHSTSHFSNRYKKYKFIRYFFIWKYYIFIIFNNKKIIIKFKLLIDFWTFSINVIRWIEMLIISRKLVSKKIYFWRYYSELCEIFIDE